MLFESRAEPVRPPACWQINVRRLIPVESAAVTALASRNTQSIAHRRRGIGIVTFADLFCGIGGFHYAVTSLGLHCVYASDIDDDACVQYEHNFGLRPEEDITKIETGRRLPGNQKLDFLVVHPKAGAVAIEAKNVREWLYTTRHEIKFLLSKAVALDSVSVLIAHRFPLLPSASLRQWLNSGLPIHICLSI